MATLCIVVRKAIAAAKQHPHRCRRSRFAVASINVVVVLVVVVSSLAASTMTSAGSIIAAPCRQPRRRIQVYHTLSGSVR
jgi:hypothetical protein